MCRTGFLVPYACRPASALPSHSQGMTSPSGHRTGPKSWLNPWLLSPPFLIPSIHTICKFVGSDLQTISMVQPLLTTCFTTPLVQGITPCLWSCGDILPGLSASPPPTSVCSPYTTGVILSAHTSDHVKTPCLSISHRVSVGSLAIAYQVLRHLMLPMISSQLPSSTSLFSVSWPSVLLFCLPGMFFPNILMSCSLTSFRPSLITLIKVASSLPPHSQCS